MKVNRLNLFLLCIRLVNIYCLPSERTKFTLINYAYSWNEARCICEQLYMTLLVMNDKEAKLVYEYISNQPPFSGVEISDVWIGLYNTGEAKYVWTTGDSLQFANWNTDLYEPNDETTDLCVRLSYHLFKTMRCSHTYKSVCEKPNGRCSMDYVGNGTIQGPEEGVKQNAGVSLNACLEICLKDVDKTKQCYAVEYSLSLGCITFSSSDISNFIVDIQSSATGDSLTTMHQKICYEGTKERGTTLKQRDSSETPLQHCSGYLPLHDTVTSEPITTTSVQIRSAETQSEITPLQDTMTSPNAALTSTPFQDSNTSPNASLTTTSIQGAITSPNAALTSKPFQDSNTSPNAALTSSLFQDANTSPNATMTSTPLQSAITSPNAALTSTSFQDANTSPNTALTSTPVKDANTSQNVVLTSTPFKDANTSPNVALTSTPFQDAIKSTNTALTSTIFQDTNTSTNAALTSTPFQDANTSPNGNTFNNSRQLVCQCTCAEAYTLIGNIEQEVQKTRQKLQVLKRNTSAARRAKTSAEDDRPSSKAIGSFGIIIIASVLTFIMFGDIFRMIRCISHEYSSRERNTGCA